nr:tetratricopeptide repeat protein [Kibdelosporangium phytohabitans]
MIHLSLGQRAEAEQYLAKALSTNPNFSITHAPVARGHLQALRSGR